MTWSGARPVARSLALGAVVGAGLLASGSAQAASAFVGLAGSWAGSGHIRLEGGRREAIRCSAHYLPRSGGAAMGLSLRCASPSGRVELRANLYSRGNRVFGSWEERSYSAAGDLSGLATGNNLRLQFSGSLSGAMVVTTSGDAQSISVRTDASTLQGVNVSLRRN
ncbi:MAG: hypothetical protein J2P50_00960 [Hyphomicrobiaceae bacterium]|nr:hypothetical protein [Hyphomicrobiaceae bacterium]